MLVYHLDNQRFPSAVRKDSTDAIGSASEILSTSVDISQHCHDPDHETQGLMVGNTDVLLRQSEQVCHEYISNPLHRTQKERVNL